jgi:hypothetical protein
MHVNFNPKYSAFLQWWIRERDSRLVGNPRSTDGVEWSVLLELSQVNTAVKQLHDECVMVERQLEVNCRLTLPTADYRPRLSRENKIL